MRSTLAPIQTRPNHRPAPASCLGGHADLLEPLPSLIGQRGVTVGDGQRARRHQMVGEAHGQRAGEMVVAGSGIRHAGRHPRGTPDRRTVPEFEHRLQQRRGLRPSKAVVAMPTLRLGRHQITVEQATEMFAARRRRHAHMTGQLGDRVGAPIEQRIEERNASVIAEELAEFDDVIVAHDEIVGADVSARAEVCPGSMGGMATSTPPVHVDDPRLVDAALLDERLQPPAVPPSLGSGSTARLRNRMARFSSPTEHAPRRDHVERRLAAIEPSALRAETVLASEWFLERSGPSVDVIAFAGTVPTVALAAAMGWVNTASDALVADVHALAAAIGRGEPATAATDAAVERLLARAADHGGNVDASVSVLYQNADATKALLLVTAAAEVGGHRREPAVRQTVRVAAEAMTLGAADGDTAIDLAAGSALELDLVSADREFGHGHHACPGRALAETIVDAALGVLRHRTQLTPVRVDRNSEDTIVGFHLG